MEGCVDEPGRSAPRGRCAARPLEASMSQRIAVILCTALATAACASFPPPTDTVANSLASVRGAEELGAANVPPAALQLQLATEEVNKAKKLMAAGENEEAHYMALRAGNDAELAIALTRENHARNEAQKAEKGVQAAKTEGATQ